MKIEPNNIYCGDGYKLIKDIPDKSIDCIYVDVPYLIDQHGKGHSELSNRCDKRNTELVDIVNGIDYSILDEFVRVSRKINIYIWCSKLQIFDIMKYFIEKNCRYEILVWVKSNPMPVGNNTWLPDIEYCLWFRDMDNNVTLNDGYELKSKWYASAINKKDKDLFNHPTIKPLELVKRHILHTTQPNDVVLDCFMGSGTTCVACKETGRQYIGIEIEEKWYNIAKDRLNGIDAKGQMCMFLK